MPLHFMQSTPETKDNGNKNLKKDFSFFLFKKSSFKLSTPIILCKLKLSKNLFFTMVGEPDFLMYLKYE